MSGNSNVEILRGDPKKAINKLAYPIIGSLLLVMLNNIIDSVWVAGLGSDPLAAIGYITPLFMILVGVGNGIGAGANSLISRFIGAKDKKGAQCNSTFINIKYNYFNRFYGAFHCNIRPYIKNYGSK